MTRVLILTGAGLGARLAGPAIRATAMARVLRNDGHDVTLATTAKVEAGWTLEGVQAASLKPGDNAAFRALESHADLIVIQGHATEQFSALAKTSKVLVVDAYDPMHLEMLEQGREQPRATWDMLVTSRVALLNHQLARADMVLCASERQRTLYLGQLAALGRVTPATYENDPSLEHLIAIAPFGLDDEPPASSGTAMRGTLPGVTAESKVLVWGGGVYSWFDPLLLIRATHALAQRKPETVLVFMGMRHPGQDPMGIVKESLDLVAELGALGRSVVVNEEWVPYDERGGFLAEADAGVSTHHDHIETEFSFRTRILDYLWAGLPMVVTEGDTFADLVEREGLGIVVPAGDGPALEDALDRILYDSEFSATAAANVARVRSAFTWDQTLAPLRAMARDPRRAADVDAAGSRERVGAAVSRLLKPMGKPGLARDVRMVAHYARHGGWSEVMRRFRGRQERA